MCVQMCMHVEATGLFEISFPIDPPQLSLIGQTAFAALADWLGWFVSKHLDPPVTPKS